MNIHTQGAFKERFAGGALELFVCEANKTFELSYFPEIWDRLPIEKKINLKDAMIRITDYWWAKGFKEAQS